MPSLKHLLNVALALGFCLSPAAGLANGRVSPAAPQGKAMRVVSLSPSNTELVYAIGAGDLLVGRTTKCDYPPAVRRVPSVGSLFPPDFERILAQRPDLVVMSDGNLNARKRIESLGIKVLVVHPRKVADIADSMRLLGNALGKKTAAEQAAATFAKNLADRSATKPTKLGVMYEVWHKPLMIPGSTTFLADLICRAGGRPIGGKLKGMWPRVNTEWAITADPSVVLTKSKARRTTYLAASSPWRHVRAVKHGRVYIVPHEAHFVRPGPRVLSAISWLRAILEGKSPHGDGN